MTLPHRKEPAEVILTRRLPHGPETADALGRGPANTVIASLAQAIAEQNATTLTAPNLRQDAYSGLPKLRPLLALAFGSVTIWVAILLAISVIV